MKKVRKSYVPLDEFYIPLDVDLIHIGNGIRNEMDCIMHGQLNCPKMVIKHEELLSEQIYGIWHIFFDFEDFWS